MSNAKAELKLGEYIEESKEFTLNDFKRVEREMNKLTKEERTKIADLWGDKSCDQMIDWVEQKKKEWTEQAYEEGKEDTDFNNHVERELGSLERQADEQCVELLDLGDTDLND